MTKYSTEIIRLNSDRQEVNRMHRLLLPSPSLSITLPFMIQMSKRVLLCNAATKVTLQNSLFCNVSLKSDHVMKTITHLWCPPAP